MKNVVKLTIFICVLAVLGCKSKTPQTSSDGSVVIEDNKMAVCIWDKVSLKESPEEKGKWLASMSLGEKCTYLESTKEDNSGKKPVTYYKVQLQDKQEGWVQSDFVILKSKPAAIVKDAEVYSRPDLLTKTNKSFSVMDIVAVKSEQGDFIEVAGKRKSGKWIETGWIKPSNVTYADVDIAVAKYGSKAMEITDRQKRNGAINEVINNSDYKSSVFINTLFHIVDDSIATEKAAKPELPE